MQKIIIIVIIRLDSIIKEVKNISENNCKLSKPGKRSFERWWASVPEDLKQKALKGQKGNNNKPLLSHVNYVLLHLHLKLCW